MIRVPEKIGAGLGESKPAPNYLVGRLENAGRSSALDKRNSENDSDLSDRFACDLTL